MTLQNAGNSYEMRIKNDYLHSVCSIPGSPLELLKYTQNRTHWKSIFVNIGL